jgi:hypothetical protein
MYLPFHDLVVLLFDHFHVKPPTPLQKTTFKIKPKIILKNDESNGNKLTIKTYKI